MRGIALVLAFSLLLSGCTTIEVGADLIKKIQNTNGKAPIYKIGNPYEVAGVWYYPERNLTYDETGIASWYGDEFGGKPTANGEIFDPQIVSAAHKTLPLPSAVRVTNLENGRALAVRINDRGPFVAGRIIDLSHEAARLLGFENKGLARVRVQILADESTNLERAAKRGYFPAIGAQARAAPKPKTSAASVPSVSLKTVNKSGQASQKEEGSVSSIDLLATSRSTEVITLTPVSTRIWIQVGAFSTKSNADLLAERLKGIGRVRITTFNHRGTQLYRVRIGPIDNIAEADATLSNAIRRGYSGARIVLE